MSSVLEPPPAVTVSPVVAPPHRFTGINLADEAFIPAGIYDLASFRRWADSEMYPSRGKFSYLAGEIWTDLSYEPIFSHNLVRSNLALALDACRDDGYLFVSGVRLSHESAEFSTEPDFVFVSYAAIQQGRVKLVHGQLGGYVELEGSPELVVEIVSPSSVRKDTEILRELYAKAGLAEYWLIDARSMSPTLEILQLTDTGYQPVPAEESGRLSRVLSRRVALIQETDPLGNPQYVFQLTALASST